MAETGGGAAEIRRALYQRQRKFHLGNMARDLGMSLGSLETFATGGAMLTPELLKALAKRLFGDNVEYDPGSDLLHRVSPEPLPAATAAPPPFDLQAAIASGHHHPVTPGHAPRRLGPPPPPPPKRSGWA